MKKGFPHSSDTARTLLGPQSSPVQAVHSSKASAGRVSPFLLFPVSSTLTALTWGDIIVRTGDLPHS